MCTHDCAEHVFHTSVCSWTVQLSLVTVLMLLCDNIGLMLAVEVQMSLHQLAGI